MRRPARTGPQAGFTLVEVLVALVAMALLSALSWLALDGVLRSRDAGREAIDRHVRLLTVLSQWESDLQSLHASGLAPAMEFDGQSLRLTRRTDDGVVVVSWALRSGMWQRWAGPVCTRAAELRSSLGRSRQLLGNEAGQLVVARGASEWQLYYFRAGAWSNAQSSGDLQPIATNRTRAGAATAGAAVAAASASGPEAGASAAANTTAAANTATAAPAAPAAATANAGPAPTYEQLPDAVRLVITLNGQQLTRTVLLGPTGS